MRVVNNLTNPGDIRRVDLTPDVVRIQTYDGAEKVYRRVPSGDDVSNPKEVTDGQDAL